MIKLQLIAACQQWVKESPLRNMVVLASSSSAYINIYDYGYDFRKQVITLKDIPTQDQLVSV